jgi:hypothetical protein
MTTYLSLKNDVLKLVDSTGATDVGALVEVGLQETLKYVASKVVLEGLISSSTYTWQTGDTEVALGSGGFEITDMETPLEMWVHDSGEDGFRHEYVKYLEFRRLKNIPSTTRDTITTAPSYNHLPDKAFTKTLDDKILPYPTPKADKICTLYYIKAPAAYSDAGEPEIPSSWTSILVFGAKLFADDMIKEPQQPTNPYNLFGLLDPQIDEFRNALRSPRTGKRMRISRKYQA